MALGDSYADVAELKTRLDINDTAEDDQLEAALATASRGIEKECSRQFNLATSATARVFEPENHCLTYVDDFSTADGLIIAIDRGEDGTYEETWTASDYQLKPLNGVVDGEIGWPFWKVQAVGRFFPCRYRRAPVQVTAKWGWAAVPAPIKEATLILAEDLFKLTSTPFGAGGFADFGRIRARENPHVLTRIAPYKRYAVLVA